ncbi:hypothetical protein D3C74_347560 [compost metagenome]
MGIELFGSGGAVYMFIACLISYLFSGHSGIYTSQQIGISKSEWVRIPEGTTLGTVNQLRTTKKTSAEE